MTSPRVLVLGSVLAQPMGGVRRHNQEVLPRAARLLRRGGGALTVLAGRDGLALELGDEIEVRSSAIPSAPALVRAAFESRELARVLAQAERDGRGFDVVHTAHLPVPRALDTPLTLTLHDLKSVFSASEPRLRRWVGRRVLADALARSAAAICVSHTLANELRDELGADAAKLRVAHNGADHLPLEPRAPTASAPTLCVGRLEPRKNVELLLRAFALEPQLGELWLAGDSKGEHAQRLEALARELRIEGRVRFLGLVDDARLAQLYATCRRVALPSLREGFDLPLVEALRAGAPLLCSNLPVHRELAGSQARYFDPLDPADFLRAAQESELAPSLPELPTWEHAAERYVDTWLNVARRR